MNREHIKLSLEKDSFKKELGERAESVNKWLSKYLIPESAFPELIHKAIAYTVTNGGKRIRPILLLEGARLANLAQENAAPFACAVELIHTYSLVHDDLPAMDDDDLRRGKPTCHIVYGEAIAILAGDGLLTYAFELMSSLENQMKLDNKCMLQAINEIAKSAGSMGMIGGQVIDLEAEGKEIDFDLLKKIHDLKTGCLFKGSLRAGAILGGMSADKLMALDSYAENFGLAFQITDDILDVTGDEMLLGKTIGSDIAKQKSTYATLLGIDNAKARARECIDSCMQSLCTFGSEADFLRNLAQYLLVRDN